MNIRIKKAFTDLSVTLINNLGMKSTWVGLFACVIGIYGLYVHNQELIAAGFTGLGAGVTYGNGYNGECK